MKGKRYITPAYYISIESAEFPLTNEIICYKYYIEPKPIRLLETSQQIVHWLLARDRVPNSRCAIGP